MNISEFEKQINEARNILIYGVNLKYHSNDYLKQQIGNKTKETIWETLLEDMHESCKVILNDGGLQFFGDTSLKIEEYPNQSLMYLDGLQAYNLIWDNMINHHCLLATYDKLNSIIFQNVILNSYNMARHINYFGVNFSYNKDFFRITVNNNNSFEFNEDKDCCHRGAADTDQASNDAYNLYPQSFNTIKKILDSHKNYTDIGKQITPSKSGNKITNVEISLSNLPLLQQLRGKGPDLKNIFKLYDGKRKITNNSLLKFIESVAYIKKSPINLPSWSNVDSNYMTNADKLYYRYKLEQTFHFDFIYCLTQNIVKLNNNFNLAFSEDFIEFAASSINLPNTFSRHLLIQMAFECCTDYHHFKSSFLYKQLTKPDAIMDYDRRTSKKTDPFETFGQWKTCYINFINYMATLVFPIYESYFFVSFHDHFSRPEKSVGENILYLYETLSNYLSRDDIFNSINGNFLVEESKKVCNRNLNKKDNSEANSDLFIFADYINSKKTMDMLQGNSQDIFQSVVLNAYNHLPEQMPMLLSQEYLNNNFGHLNKSFINACITDLLDANN